MSSSGKRVTGFALLLTATLSGCARHTPYWSRVQAVAPQTKTWVRLYENEAPRGERKIKGRLHSVAADAVTLEFKDGQMRTLQKQAVRKVLIRRPFAKRVPGWAAALTAIGLLEGFDRAAGNANLTARERSRLYPMIVFPTAAAFFYGSRMAGIYSVPPKRRTQSPGTP